MTPAAIEWRQRMMAKWGTRAMELRASRDHGAQQRALGLEWVVAGMQREIGAPAPDRRAMATATALPAPSGEDALRRQLAAIQPRFDAALGVIVNDGPIMDAVRARLQARLDGAPYASVQSPPLPSPIAAPAATVPAEVIPFIVGPQLALFGDAL